MYWITKALWGWRASMLVYNSWRRGVRGRCGQLPSPLFSSVVSLRKPNVRVISTFDRVRNSDSFKDSWTWKKIKALPTIYIYRKRLQFMTNFHYRRSKLIFKSFRFMVIPVTGLPPPPPSTYSNRKLHFKMLKFNFTKNKKS